MRRRASALATLFLCICAIPPIARAADTQAPKGNPFEKSILAFEAADKKTPPPANANLFIGSSSIVKWKTLAADFPGAAVINRGFGGSRIADSTYFAARIILPYHPSRIFFYAGDNDLAAGHTPEQVLADFKSFVETVRAGQADVPIFFISIKPSPSRAKLLDKARQANQLIESWSKEGKDLNYVNVFAPMLGPDGQPRPELFGPDRLHMNAAGYELWKWIIGPLVK